MSVLAALIAAALVQCIFGGLLKQVWAMNSIGIDKYGGNFVATPSAANYAAKRTFPLLNILTASEIPLGPLAAMSIPARAAMAPYLRIFGPSFLTK